MNEIETKLQDSKFESLNILIGARACHHLMHLMNSSPFKTHIIKCETYIHDFFANLIK